MKIRKGTLILKIVITIILCMLFILIFSLTKKKCTSVEIISNNLIVGMNESMPYVEIDNFDYYRLTSYYNGDSMSSGSKTGSGKSISDFQINEKGWYTYKGKLVLAAATEELLKSGYSVRMANVRQDEKHYFRYYDEVTIVIDGISYNGIILDSCGASMWYGETRVDLFVSSKEYLVDRKNVKVSW